MANHIFLSGHGGWEPSQGYTQVPRGCKVHFYTHFAKNLITGMEYKILEGTYNNIERTIDEFMMCPNMLLSEQEESWTQASRAALARRNDPDCVLLPAPSEGFTLNQLFSAWADAGLDSAEFHWLACQTLKLRQVGGRNFGLNAGDFAHENTNPGRYRIRKAGGQFEWI